MQNIKCCFCDTYLSKFATKVIVAEFDKSLNYYCEYCFNNLQLYVKDFVIDT